MEFGGYPVEMRLVNGRDGQEVLIHCKNVTGTFSQAKAFKNKTNYVNQYPWGIKTSAPAFITDVPGERVSIACLTDTRQKFLELYDKCEELLNE